MSYENFNKHLVLFIAIAISFAICGNSQVDVTFKVDMQYQDVSANGVHITGSL